MRILSLILLLAAATAHAESHEELVERAFDALADDIHEQWSFTETTSNRDGTFVATHDPQRDEKWQLLSVDGREPTQKELDDFLADKSGDSDSGGDDRESRVADGSLELLEETDDYFLFSFSPSIGDEEDKAFMDSVRGRLKVIKDGPYVAELKLENDGPIKPGKGVKIKTFKTHLQFAPIEEGGPVLIQSVDVEVKGRAMLVVGFDEQESVRFSDYRRRRAHP
jgi:hypothetical protein